MARESKYVSYVGKRVNEVSSVQVPSSQNYLITKFEREKRASKSKRGYYYSYKLQLENGVWLSTQTFNKYVKRGFFSKQVIKKIQDAKQVSDFDLFSNDSPFIEIKPKATGITSRLSIDELIDISNDADSWLGSFVENFLNATIQDRLVNINWTQKTLLFNTQDELFNSWFDWLDEECDEISKNLGNSSEFDVFKYYHWHYTYRPIIKNIINSFWQRILERDYLVIENLYFKDFKKLDFKDAKKLHKQLAKKWHTDNLETGNVEMFKVTQNAYERYIEWYEKRGKKRQRKAKNVVKSQQAGKLYLLA